LGEKKLTEKNPLSVEKASLFFQENPLMDSQSTEEKPSVGRRRFNEKSWLFLGGIVKIKILCTCVDSNQHLLKSPAINMFLYLWSPQITITLTEGALLIWGRKIAAMARG